MHSSTLLRWITLIAIAASLTLNGVPARASLPSVAALPGMHYMSAKTKLVLVAGAAALYWLYKRHQNSKGVGPNGQYYRSKNGRVYYRDAKTHQAIWVTPPPTSKPIQVPADEYQKYVGSVPAGYNDGRVLTSAPSGM